MKRTLLIGDVHGCIDEVLALLRACDAAPDDRLLFIGDLVAKGPDSQAVVQLARERQAEAVLGNHEDHLLRARAANSDARLKPGHRSVFAALTAADWAFLERLPLFLALPEHGALAVHAGLVPGVPLAAQRREDLLALRSLTPEGKGSSRILDGTPWAKSWTGPEHVVFGHDAVRGLQLEPFATGLDTGCVYGGELTALILPERRLVSVKARRVYAEPR